MLQAKDIEFIEFNVTSLCNSKCPMCLRTMALYPPEDLKEHITHKFVTSSMPPELFKTIASGLGEHAKNITASFCGTTGDAPNHPKIDEILDVAVEMYKSVNMETNGSVRSTEWWKKVGTKFNFGLGHNFKIRFAIDGLADTNPLYRINTSFDKIMENAQAFIDAGGYAQWKFLIFDHNKHQIEQARELSKRMGFKEFITTSGKRFDDNQYKIENKLYKNKASSVDDTVKENGFVLAPAMEVDQKLQKSTEYRNKILKDPTSINDDVEIDCRTRNERYLFVDQFGKLWPCCFWSSQHEQNWAGHANWDYWWDKFQTSYGYNFNQLSSSNTILNMIDHDLLSNWLPQSFLGEHKKCDVCVHNCTKGMTSVNDLQRN
jgi:hypothetical protein